MNFSAFTSNLSNLGNFKDFSLSNSNFQDSASNRYTSNFVPQSMSSASTGTNSTVHYGQNITLPSYSQHQISHEYTSNDRETHKTKSHHNSHTKERDDSLNHQIQNNQSILNQSWPSTLTNQNSVDYSSHLLSATLPISLQHFLKYSETMKKDHVSSSNSVNNILNSSLNSSNLGNLSNSFDNSSLNLKNDLLGLKNGSANNLNLSNLSHLNNQWTNSDSHDIGRSLQQHGNNSLNIPSHGMHNNLLTHQVTSNNGGNLGNKMSATTVSLTNGLTVASSSSPNIKAKKQRKKAVKQENGIPVKRVKKKRPAKERKPRPKPGEIRETTALDGSKLYCCPECQMAYPERGLVEEHVVQHAVERRFVCDICHAALKRKDHLTRHKLSHIPDRPHCCNICNKTFKRKEQLTLHYVIHSGEKKHVCIECNKGFYRKDHLRKHTRSHIARRVKSEMTTGNGAGMPTMNLNGQQSVQAS